MRINVYIDAFNLYYLALRHGPYKWLNLEELSRKLFPEGDIQAIKYFTAKISGWPDDPDKPNRQQLYLRALRTLPRVSIIYGHYRSHEAYLPLVGSPETKVAVIKTEEKGSDVNLGTHLLHDGHMKRYDLAAVLSNDSDLEAPIRLVREELQRPVIVISPRLDESPTRRLVDAASSIKKLRKGVLQSSQFPERLRDSRGTFHKPPLWSPEAPSERPGPRPQ